MVVSRERQQSLPSLEVEANAVKKVDTEMAKTARTRNILVTPQFGGVRSVGFGIRTIPKVILTNGH